MRSPSRNTSPWERRTVRARPKPPTGWSGWCVPRSPPTTATRRRTRCRGCAPCRPVDRWAGTPGSPPRTRPAPGARARRWRRSRPRGPGGHAVCAGAREDQRAGEGRRAVDHPAETVRTMARLRLSALIALAGHAACGHGPTLTPASQPDVALARARREFHRGDCTHAMVTLRRLTYELGPTTPERAA